MLLLVDDQQAEIGELDALAEQRVGADDDIDVARFEPRLDLGALLGADEARGLRDLHREAAEALGEGVEVLARQQRGRHHDGDLLAGEHGDQAARSATSVLPKPTSPQISRSIGRPLARSSSTAPMLVVLVLGLLVGEARGELVIDALRRVEHRRLAQLAQRRDLDQLLGHVADALLQAGFARLPGDAAQPVELHARLRRSRSGVSSSIFSTGR